MSMFLMISGMAIVTYLPRVLPSLFMDRIHLSKRFEQFLRLIPYTALTAMVFPAVLYVDDSLWIGLLGSLFAIGCAWKKLPTILVVVLTIGFVFSLYLLGI